MVGVYAIIHLPTGRMYIGCSVRVHARWTNHKSDLNRQVHHSPFLQRVWNQGDEDAFEFVVLCETTRENLRKEERRLIREHKPVFNTMESRSPGPLRHSAVTRAKMSDAQKRIWAERRAQGNTKKSEETKAKIAAAHRGKKHSEEAKAKMRAAKLGKVPWNKGRKLSKEERAEIGRKTAKAWADGKFKNRAHTGRKKQRPFEE